MILSTDNGVTKHLKVRQDISMDLQAYYQENLLYIHLQSIIYRLRVPALSVEDIYAKILQLKQFLKTTSLITMQPMQTVNFVATC